jgi:hypothetical protein
MKSFIRKYFLISIALVMLILTACQTAYGSPQSASTHKAVISKYDHKETAISHSLKLLNQGETSCSPDLLGCFKKEWLSHKDRLNSADRVHWRKICKIKIALCKNKFLNDRGNVVNQ